MRLNEKPPCRRQRDEKAMTPDQQPIVWDHAYRVKLAGESPYAWDVKSQRVLQEGDRFWLPLAPDIPAEQSWVRPIWKPRQSPNFVHVRVDRVVDQTLILGRI